MDQTQSWAQALNIDAESLSRWSAEVPAGQPLLVYCLERGYVDVDQYLAWAAEAFGLARLQDRFFTEACDEELVRGAHELESYSAWFFPVGRWDDVIYVACVEAPHPDDAPPGYCFLLADPRVMRQTWSSTAGEAGERISLTNVSIGHDSPTGVVDVPQGLHAGETKLFTLNLDGISMNLDGHLSPPPVEDDAVDESSLVLEDATRLTNTDLIAEVVEAPARPSVPPPTFAPPAVAPPPARAPVPPRATAPPLAPPAATAPTEITALSLPSSETGALTRVFEHLNKTFGQSCVLRRTDDMIKLYKWGLGLSPAGQGVALDLNYPSFLRIVARTRMPYHGYLIDSPTHREFFRGLGLDELPGCVSAVPLMIDEDLWGVLMTVGGPELRDLSNLSLVEDAARQLTETLSPAWRKSA